MITQLFQVKKITDVRQAIKAARDQGKRIGFVPTMGYLHEGHLSLIKQARESCDFVVMSIFVNPLQFGPTEDFSRYPRDMERDLELARTADVDILFTPEVEEMYPQKVLTTVSVTKVSEPLCGKSRPGHFDGVATVVLKLFNIVQPDAAFFGQKDAQQVAVIDQMVSDLSVPVEVVHCRIVREVDGLAMSSRNVYLSPEERKQAVVLSRSLRLAQERIQAGASISAVKAEVFQLIAEQPLAEIDYVETLKYPQLVPVRDDEKGSNICIALAVRFGRTRLIDNLITII